MDPNTFERFKQGVEEEWCHPQVADAYRKWDQEEAAWGGAARDLIIDRAGLSPGLHVLDIGSAHGEPGLAIAATVGPTGHATLLDIAPALLEIAGERAQREGLSNVTTRMADAHELPFSDGTFDRVTSRLAAMYFADHPRAFREALRVLRPGGRAVYLVWGSFDQPMFRDFIGVLFKYVALPEDEPGAPSPFRFSEAGTLARGLEDAGFVDVREETATLPTTFSGDPQRWWEWLTDMAPPVQAWMAGLSEASRKQAMAEIEGALRRYQDGGSVNLPIEVIVGSGHKRA